jgi:type II secretory pathway pseudopilin PulG
MHGAPPSRPPCSARSARAFTLVEALVALAVTTIAGSVLLAGMSSSLATTDEALKRTVAGGMAEQLIDEVLGAKYCADLSNPYETSLSRSSFEAGGLGRELYNDIDDYNGTRTQPPADMWSVPLGKDNGQGGERHPAFQAVPKFIKHWRQEIDVYYVSESDLTTRLASGSTSDYRAVEVRIVAEVPGGGTRVLARLRRIVAYVPPPP